jgi:hypothetical protein
MQNKLNASGTTSVIYFNVQSLITTVLMTGITDLNERSVIDGD